MLLNGATACGTPQAAVEAWARALGSTSRRAGAKSDGEEGPVAGVVAYEDPALTEYVARVGRRLARRAKPRLLAYR